MSQRDIDAAVEALKKLKQDDRNAVYDQLFDDVEHADDLRLAAENAKLNDEIGYPKCIGAAVRGADHCTCNRACVRRVTAKRAKTWWSLERKKMENAR